MPPEAEQQVDPLRCPSCQRPNGCATAEGKTPCWCFEVVMDPQALAKLRPEQHGACLCRECGVKKE